MEYILVHVLNPQREQTTCSICSRLITTQPSLQSAQLWYVTGPHAVRLHPQEQVVMVNIWVPAAIAGARRSNVLQMKNRHS